MTMRKPLVQRAATESSPSPLVPHLTDHYKQSEKPPNPPSQTRIGFSACKWQRDTPKRYTDGILEHRETCRQRENCQREALPACRALGSTRLLSRDNDEVGFYGFLISRNETGPGPDAIDGKFFHMYVDTRLDCHWIRLMVVHRSLIEL